MFGCSNKAADNIHFTRSRLRTAVLVSGNLAYQFTCLNPKAVKLLDEVNYFSGPIRVGVRTFEGVFFEV
jgi:hypothetical protein